MQTNRDPHLPHPLSLRCSTILHNTANSDNLYGANGPPNLPGTGRTLGAG